MSSTVLENLRNVVDEEEFQTWKSAYVKLKAEFEEDWSTIALGNGPSTEARQVYQWLQGHARPLDDDSVFEYITDLPLPRGEWDTLRPLVLANKPHIIPSIWPDRNPEHHCYRVFFTLDKLLDGVHGNSLEFIEICLDGESFSLELDFALDEAIPSLDDILELMQAVQRQTPSFAFQLSLDGTREPHDSDAFFQQIMKPCIVHTTHRVAFGTNSDT